MITTKCFYIKLHCTNIPTASKLMLHAMMDFLTINISTCCKIQHLGVFLEYLADTNQISPNQHECSNNILIKHDGRFFVLIFAVLTNHMCVILNHKK